MSTPPSAPAGSRPADDAEMSEIAAGLVLLTAGLAAAGLDISSGLLGGEFGYGGIYENDVFMMHPYCWCERDDCPWCAVCSCPDEAWEYFVDGERCTYEEYQEFFDNVVGPAPRTPVGLNAWERRAEKANARRSQVHVPMCRWCASPQDVRPNFLHKDSGTSVTWYKYIGRSMEARLGGQWADILAECLESLRVPLAAQ